MPANKAVVKTQLLDEERMAILMNILECKKKDALRCIAGTWVRQYELIHKGWTWVTPVCRQLGLPSAFISMIRNSSAISSLNGQFDQKEFC